VDRAAIHRGDGEAVRNYHINPLTDVERKWLRSRWELLNEARKKADIASFKWNEMNAKLKVWFEQSGITDPNQQAKIKAPNLELKEHMAVWDFYRRDVDRYASEIMAFKAMKDMEAL
jgi:hypothetical protein